MGYGLCVLVQNVAFQIRAACLFWVQKCCLQIWAVSSRMGLIIWAFFLNLDRRFVKTRYNMSRRLFVLISFFL